MTTEIRYAIVAIAGATDQRIADCIQTDRDSLRTSVDGTQAILKYHRPAPASMVGLRNIDHLHALAEMTTTAWQDDE